MALMRQVNAVSIHVSSFFFSYLIIWYLNTCNHVYVPKITFAAHVADGYNCTLHLLLHQSTAHEASISDVDRAPALLYDGCSKRKVNPFGAVFSELLNGC